MRRLLLCATLAVCTHVQRGAGAEARPALISGSVLAKDTAEPLSRAQILLRPLEAGLSPVVAESDERGRFVFRGLKPGNYSVTVQRDGFLPVSFGMRGQMRMPPILTVEAGTQVRALVFRLPRWGVVTGKVKFDTGEPGVNISIQLFRQAFIRQRKSFAVAATGRTNDLGEYRIAGLSPGDYFVAATYSRALPADAIEQEPTDEDGRALPRLAYAPMFYPSALKMSDAVPVHVEQGQEVGGADIYLKPVPVVRVRGRVIAGGSGQVIPGGAVSVRRAADGASLNVPVAVRPWRDGFEIPGLTSGAYVLLAETEENGIRYSTRHPLLVTDAPIDNVELVLAPAREWAIQIQTDGEPGDFDPDKLRITLEPRTDLNPTVTAQVNRKGALTAWVSQDETYDLFVSNLPPDYYVKSLRVGNQERLESGLSGSAASTTAPLQVIVGVKGGTVAGRAYRADGWPATGANVTLVPDAGPSVAQWYRSGSADEYGIFQIRGLAPGTYTAFAYYDEPPCEFYDREELYACRSKGREVTVTEGSQAIMNLPLAR